MSLLGQQNACEAMEGYAKAHMDSIVNANRANYLRFTRIPELEAELAEARRFLSQHGSLTPGWYMGDLAPLD